MEENSFQFLPSNLTPDLGGIYPSGPVELCDSSSRLPDLVPGSGEMTRESGGAVVQLS